MGDQVEFIMEVKDNMKLPVTDAVSMPVKRAVCRSETN